MRLVLGDSHRYHSRTPRGLTVFPVIRSSTARALSGLLALGVASAALDGVVLAPSVLSRTTSAVELRLRRFPGRVDVVIAGLGTEVRAVSQNSRMAVGRPS